MEHVANRQRSRPSLLANGIIVSGIILAACSFFAAACLVVEQCLIWGAAHGALVIPSDV